MRGNLCTCVLNKISESSLLHVFHYTVFHPHNKLVKRQGITTSLITKNHQVAMAM